LQIKEEFARYKPGYLAFPRNSQHTKIIAGKVILSDTVEELTFNIPKSSALFGFLEP
jgi:hypothetical protein